MDRRQQDTRRTKQLGVPACQKAAPSVPPQREERSPPSRPASTPRCRPKWETPKAPSFAIDADSVKPPIKNERYGVIGNC